MKLKLKATKLENADVSFISLVERGANRAPFKIIKAQEKNAMINLSRVFKTPASQPAEAQIIGYVIQKEADSERVRKALSDSGVKIDAVQEFEDGTVLFKQADVEINEDDNTLVPVKLNDDLVVLCKGFNPYREGEAAQSISDAVKTQGFYPGMSMATEALYQVVRNSFREATDKNDAVKRLAGAMSEYTDYMLALAKEIPQTAFTASDNMVAAKEEDTVAKAEIEKASKVCKSCGAPCDEEGKYKATKAEIMVPNKDAEADAAAAHAAAVAAPGGEPAPVVEPAPAGDPPPAQDPAPAGDPPAQDPAESVQKQLAEQIAAMGKSITDAVTAQITAVNESVAKSLTEINVKVDAVAKDATEAKDLAKKADDDLRTVVPADPQSQDPHNPKQVVKTGQGMGNIDTAFQKNIRKGEKRYSDTAYSGVRSL